MWRELDDNVQEKLGKHHSKDRDVDIDINININGNGRGRDIDCFPNIGRGAHSDASLNLCDVASKLGDVVSSGRSAIGAAAAVEAFNEISKKKDEPAFIDCQWDRLVDHKRQEMQHSYSRIGAALKGSQG